MRSSRKAKRHQSTPACARCNKLKQKCDRGTPRCSRCVASGTECMAVGRGTSAQIPRSIVQHLEHRLAELQQGIRKPGYHRASEDHYGSSRKSQSHAQVAELTYLSIQSHLTSSLFRDGDQIQHYAKLFYPSERPPLKIPVRGVYHDIHRRTAGRAYTAQSSHFKARNIPIHVATRLFRNYHDEILPRFPCFFEDDLNVLFSQFYNTAVNPSPAAERSCFVIPMILAISALTSNSHDVPKVAALSESLYADAMHHAGLLKDASISSLQSILLLIQLTLLLPYTCNAWYMTGEAMRMAVSLGLHQELDPAISNDTEHAELRRRIFWTTYQLDRTVAISAGCPVALSDEHITTRLPYHGGEIHLMSTDPTLFSTRNAREAQFLIHARVRSVQSQVHGVQFFDQDLPSSTVDYESWVNNTATVINDLISQVPANGVSRTWLGAAAQQCQVLLHRPCSRNIAVSDASLVAGVQASIQLLISHTAAVQAGGFVMAFELANSAFQAGMVLLYALRNHFHVLEQTSLRDPAHESLDSLPVLLERLAIRWPSVSDTAHYIRELIDTCLRNPVGHDGNMYDMNVLEELDCLVTQRRVHTLQHRNIPFPPHRGLGAQSDTASQASEGFLDNEDWWSAFIRDDLDMADDAALGSTLESMPVVLVTPDRIETPRVAKSSHMPAQTEAQAVNISTEVDELLKALPSCSYCRDRRIKCNQQIPACQECQRTSRECVIFDPVLEGNVPLRRLGLLIDNIKAVENDSRATAAVAKPRESTSSDYVLLPLDLTVHNSNFECAIVFGPWSSIGLLRRCVSQSAVVETSQAIREAIQLPSHKLDPCFVCNDRLPPIATATALCQLFTRTTNVFYKILDQSHLDDLMSECYTPGAGAQRSQGHDMLYLVFAIASHTGKRSDPGLAAQSEAYFARARSAMGTTCDHASRDANIVLLQRTLLICVYLLLNPSSGDIWRHLGFAIRHFLDLAHRPSLEEDQYQDIMSTLTRTLYALESQVSIAFGRPSLLSIGDDLRADLTKTVSDHIEDQIAVFSYLISFQKMQIHKALIGSDTSSTQYATFGDKVRSEASDFRGGLDEWFLRWKELLSTLPDDEAKANLTSWGLFQYHHGILLLSLLQPESEVTATGTAIGSALLHLVRHQQLFSRPYSAPWPQRPPLASPVTWAMSYAILQVWLQTYLTETSRTTQWEQVGRTLNQLDPLIMILEADPDNLLTGMSLNLESLHRQASGTWGGI